LLADALADAYDAGLVKAVGVSNYGLDEIKRMHAALQKRNIPLASNQISFSLLRTIPEKSGLIQLCHDLGVAVLAYSRKLITSTSLIFTHLFPSFQRLVWVC
jgi:diketogulonate reductase-like aldo/keto reductase